MVMSGAPRRGRLWSFFRAFILAVAGLALAAPPISAGETLRPEELSVLALAPADGRAVVQKPDGSLLLMRVGDEIAAAGLTLRKVLPDRAVLEEKASRPGAARRRIWIFRAEEGKPSRVQVLDPERPAETPVVRPGSGE